VSWALLAQRASDGKELRKVAPVSEKDHYKVLGVAKDADQAAIKKAYRALAKDLHPDKNPGDAKVEERFKEVSAAYDVLGAPSMTRCSA
jgi:DnaJ-class molecular chaperone